MTEQKTLSPLRVGLLIVALSYFLFTLHALFTLQWIGEWNSFPGGFSFYVFATDIAAGVGLVFRFAASFIAATAAIRYFDRELPYTKKFYRLLRCILVLEAIYWLGLLTTAVLNVQQSLQSIGHMAASTVLTQLALNTIPSIVEAIAIPAALLILAWKLSPNKPQDSAIKWALITGTFYIFVFWLTNTSMWFITIMYQTGTKYLILYPENMVNFIITTIGLLALTIYSAYFTFKSRRTQTWQELNLRTAGAVILALGMFFLWNYLTWIFWGGNYLWSEWFAWFLGHNLDLWMLSLPLVGLPLLFYSKPAKQTANTENKNA
ncbi:MAG: hypothetical protein M1167_02635 [Chloroflexi bacterium]|nr:hypothetical protein [Chloroflexota bacterium]